MRSASPNPVVHLELHTCNLPRACAFYTQLLGWHAERVEVAHGSYLTLSLGAAIEGGVVEHDVERALWLPYVQVTDVRAAVERACGLGASVLLERREGPAGWRSVVATRAGAELGLWQPKA
jgi:predicted enzyme related to lactoylglutathione lyase